MTYLSDLVREVFYSFYMLNFFTIALLYFYLITLTPLQGQSLLINEVLASNTKVNYDGFGEFDDWIELYNPNDSVVYLAGMYISDNPNDPEKHQFNLKNDYWLSIKAHDYIVLWLDGDPEQGKRHLPFRLNKEKGSIKIYDAQLNVIDKIVYQRQTKNISTGRLDSSFPEIGVFKKPSPGKANKKGLRIMPKHALVEANIASGFYTNSIQIQLSSRFDGQIYYTTNGAEPSKKDSLYRHPIDIDSNTVLRTRLLREGYTKGAISTKNYFINTQHDLPIVSLSTDPKHLWNKKKGIYRNFERRGWEKPAHVDYFDKDSQGQFLHAFSKSIDIRIAGKTSRRQAKKSIAMFANDLDGQERINYQIFDDKPINSFASIWLRADATSGRNVPQLWVGERFKNELLYEVNKSMNGNVDMQAYQPVLLYLNGQFWGLYNLMERKGSDFIQNNHGIASADILTGENTKKVKGSEADYLALMDYLALADITQDSIYQTVCQQIEIESYIDYWIYECYSGAHDINVNIRYWKADNEGSKWRWISYDQDSWHTAQENSLNYFIDDDRVYLLKKLLKNQQFRNQFINRCCDFLNAALKTEQVLNKLNSITKRIENAVELDKKRWQDTLLYVPKNERIDWMKEYAKLRPDYLRNHLIEYFGLGGNSQQIMVDASETNGAVRVNSLGLKRKRWTGIYLENVPIKITAVADKGYRFVRWKNKQLERSATLNISVSKQQSFIPVFKKSKFNRSKKKLNS